MWIERDFGSSTVVSTALPIKVLKGPRQVGKTSFLERLGSHSVVYLDDAAVRIRAQENPRFFLDNSPKRVVLDEAALAPALFPELKRRVDEQRRNRANADQLDVWITGSNQTLLQRNVRESLAGRASYFDLNTLSIHELGSLYSPPDFFFKGGWPELYVSTNLDPVRYLNDLISTFIENDIVSAAGIERKAAFTKSLQLLAGRVGQLFNASDIATNVGVDVTTIQSWTELLEANGILRRLAPYYSNRNKRLTKTPKYYFEDVAIATRLQGWTELTPLLSHPFVGSLIENIALSEFSRFFVNRGETPQFNFLRSKEKVEVDLLVHLPNQRVLAVEIKTTPQDFSPAQLRLLENLNLTIIESWVVSPNTAPRLPHARIVPLAEVSQALQEIY
jgi:uncharacterized protein